MKRRLLFSTNVLRQPVGPKMLVTINLCCTTSQNSKDLSSAC